MNVKPSDEEPRADSEWKVVQGTGWVDMPGFGAINPRRDNVSGGREYFTAKTENEEIASATGSSITGGPETWYFAPDDLFFLADSAGHCVEVTISFLLGGSYAVKYRLGIWPGGETGGW